jgi:Tfp pilus assembly protein PilN
VAGLQCGVSHEIMKEIDFLPCWYKTGQKRQVNRRTQCIVLSGVFVLMMVWSLASTRSISNVKAEIAQAALQCEQAKKTSAEMIKMSKELKNLQEKIQSVEKVDSKIDIPSVLGEISSLVDEMIVLSKVEFAAEKFAQDREEGLSSSSGAIVRIAQNQLGGKKNLLVGHVRFKVTIAGVAADAGDVAALISRLEQSPYFRQVVLSFSRNVEVRNQGATSLRDIDVLRESLETGEGGVANVGKLQVSEFQINCYLGNYHEL